MLRRTAAIFACCIALTGSASARQQPDVVVELRPSNDVPNVAVRVTALLSDVRFLNAMRSGFPLYVEFEVELRHSRSNWFDPVADRSYWEYVVLYDPVRDTFVFEDGDGSEEVSGEAALRQKLGTVYLVGLTPDDNGTFYYEATVNARTLSDEDVDEVFDWLKGDSDTTTVQRRGVVTRTARRLLVQMAPLPRLKMSGKSQRFRWPRQLPLPNPPSQ